MTSSSRPTIQVAPLKRMPFSRCCFDYEDPGLKLSPGDLVRIPFRAGTLAGLVLGPGSGEKIKTPLKPVMEKIFIAPALATPQLNFLREVSEIYHTNLNFILKTALLPWQPQKIKKTVLSPLPRRSRRAPVKPRAFFTGSPEAEMAYLKKNMPPTGQILILVPGTADLLPAAARLKKNTTRKFRVLPGDHNDKNWFADWLATRNDPEALFIGTRKALFLPWTNLTAIFLLDEGNFDYKSWDMAPRFHTRDAALLLARQFSATLHLLSSTPSVETYFFARHGIYEAPKIMPEKITHAPRLINLRPEKQNQNFSGLSPQLITAMDRLTDGDIFLFLNRRDRGRQIFCRACQKTARCPRCGLILTTGKQTETLNCPDRHHSFPAGRCPDCHSPDIFTWASGAADLKKIIQKKFGHLYTVITVEKNDAAIIPKVGKKIIIGTRHAWPRLDWSRLGLLAFLDADGSLQVPEYQAAEELWQTIRAASGKLPDTAEFFIQTENPEHPVLAAIPQPENFYAHELSQRKIFTYPPFCFILKIFYREKRGQKASPDPEVIIRRLRDLTREEKNVKVDGPFPGIKITGTSGVNTVILVKIGYDRYKTLIKKINRLLPNDDWQVDPHPNNLLKF